MRRLLSLAVLPAFALVVASSPRPVAAEEVKIKGPWDGFGVGSFVQQKTTSTMAGIPGMDAPPQVAESKQTLVKITDDTYFIKAESKMGDAWQGTEIPYPRKATAGPGENVKTPKPEDLGEEKVTVDGTDIACKKVRVTQGGMTTTSWNNEMYGPVKTEATGNGSTMTQLLTKLSGKTKIGSVDVEYREMTTTVKSDAMSMKQTQWMSESVPGGVVRSEATTEMPGGMKTVALTETVAFEKK